MTKRVYKAPSSVADKEAIDTLNGDDLKKLRMLPINLSFNHENWRFIQDICVKLSDHEDVYVRSNSILGLAHTARFKGRIEKNIVKPVLLRALKDIDPLVVGTAEDAIGDINRIMNWKIGHAKKQKIIESNYKKRNANQAVVDNSVRASLRATL